MMDSEGGGGVDGYRLRDESGWAVAPGGVEALEAGSRL
jgi:hypothetical protein